jgi:hypothetical protein
MIYWGEKFDKFNSIFAKFGAVIDLCPLKGKHFGQSSENGKFDFGE